MTLHLLFLTISISKNRATIEEIQQKERTTKILEEMKDKQLAVYRTF